MSVMEKQPWRGLIFQSSKIYCQSSNQNTHHQERNQNQYLTYYEETPFSTCFSMLNVNSIYQNQKDTWKYTDSSSKTMKQRNNILISFFNKSLLISWSSLTAWKKSQPHHSDVSPKSKL